MKFFSTLLILISWNIFTAYSQNIKNRFFHDLNSIICPFDSTRQITAPEHWVIYQTVDGRWNSPIDSSKCIDVLGIGNDVVIDLTKVDARKPLFIRYLVENTDTLHLKSNFLYDISSRFRSFPTDAINLSDSCANDLCSGILIGIRVPDESGQGTASRIHTATALTDGSIGNASICLPTEYFTRQSLETFLFKISFNEDSLTQESIYLDFASLTEPLFQGTISQLSVAPEYYSDTAYYVKIHQASNTFGENYLLLYPTPSLYPGPNAQGFIDVELQENTDTQAIINLIVDPYQTLVAQPFTSLRGGLVDGSDSLRHQLNLVNNGATFCISFLDLVFSGSTSYIHQGGTIDLANGFSCMQFLDGGKLVVADNTDLLYGNRGVGVLALRQGGTIEIGKNSSLTINNLLIMNESRPGEAAQIYMELNEGSRLLFGEQSRLSNAGSLGRQMKLNIYMNGGILDEQHLSPAERALINKIYPSLPPPNYDAIHVFPNPASEQLYIEFAQAEATIVHIAISDLNGRQLMNRQEHLDSGKHQLRLPLAGLSSGLYYISMRTDTHTFFEKIVVSR